MSASTAADDVDDIFDGVVIVVPPEERASLQRGVPKRRNDLGRSSQLGMPLFMFVGLPVIGVIGAAIGFALSVL